MANPIPANHLNPNPASSHRLPPSCQSHDETVASDAEDSHSKHRLPTTTKRAKSRPRPSLTMSKLIHRRLFSPPRAPPFSPTPSP
ncbi:hypothetical protein ACFX15_006057 [Malus domestica]